MSTTTTTDYINAVINSNLKVLHRCDPLDITFAFAFGLAEELIELHEELTTGFYDEFKTDEEMGDVAAFATLTLYFAYVHNGFSDEESREFTIADLDKTFGDKLPYFARGAEETVLTYSKRITKHFRKVATNVEEYNPGLIRQVLRKTYDEYCDRSMTPKTWQSILNANAAKIIARTANGSLNKARPADQQ